MTKMALFRPNAQCALANSTISCGESKRTLTFSPLCRENKWREIRPFGSRLPAPPSFRGILRWRVDLGWILAPAQTTNHRRIGEGLAGRWRCPGAPSRWDAANAARSKTPDPHLRSGRSIRSRATKWVPANPRLFRRWAPGQNSPARDLWTGVI